MSTIGTYPATPGFKVSGASEDTAASIAPIVAVLRDQVLEVITANSPGGITADDVAHDLGRSILSVRPRVSELRRLGVIRPSGARGRNASGMTASLWVLTDTSVHDGTKQVDER